MGRGFDSPHLHRCAGGIGRARSGLDLVLVVFVFSCLAAFLGCDAWWCPAGFLMAGEGSIPLPPPRPSGALDRFFTPSVTARRGLSCSGRALTERLYRLHREGGAPPELDFQPAASPHLAAGETKTHTFRLPHGVGEARASDRIGRSTAEGAALAPSD